ncbi:hypothetical protein B0T17DRAFT_247875 [Bombardia bombarda]|uniref:Secreted protein n=1 Tax=Bombardia bombarda TaxID=252184 RepID=A0AA39WZU2_9PEZI|nr:hypothetical protein B0T17DRAFT_247875 [Bombardia bombarda]
MHLASFLAFSVWHLGLGQAKDMGTSEQHPPLATTHLTFFYVDNYLPYSLSSLAKRVNFLPESTGSSLGGILRIFVAAFCFCARSDGLGSRTLRIRRRRMFLRLQLGQKRGHSSFLQGRTGLCLIHETVCHSVCLKCFHVWWR